MQDAGGPFEAACEVLQRVAVLGEDDDRLRRADRARRESADNLVSGSTPPQPWRRASVSSRRSSARLSVDRRTSTRVSRRRRPRRPRPAGARAALPFPAPAPGRMRRRRSARARARSRTPACGASARPARHRDPCRRGPAALPRLNSASSTCMRRSWPLAATSTRCTRRPGRVRLLRGSAEYEQAIAVSRHGRTASVEALAIAAVRRGRQQHDVRRSRGQDGDGPCRSVAAARPCASSTIMTSQRHPATAASTSGRLM